MEDLGILRLPRPRDTHVTGAGPREGSTKDVLALKQLRIIHPQMVHIVALPKQLLAPRILQHLHPCLLEMRGSGI